MPNDYKEQLRKEIRKYNNKLKAWQNKGVRFSVQPIDIDIERATQQDLDYIKARQMTLFDTASFEYQGKFFRGVDVKEGVALEEKNKAQARQRVKQKPTQSSRTPGVPTEKLPNEFDIIIDNTLDLVNRFDAFAHQFSGMESDKQTLKDNLTFALSTILTSSAQKRRDLVDKISHLYETISELLNRIPSGKEEWEQYEIDKADLYNTLADIISFGSEVEDVF